MPYVYWHIVYWSPRRVWTHRNGVVVVDCPNWTLGGLWGCWHPFQVGGMAEGRTPWEALEWAQAIHPHVDMQLLTHWADAEE